MKAFCCVGTHWDREWYETFQEYRMWLVEQIDEVMDVMDADPAFKYFHLDGQAVVLDDYLRIRPENRERLTAFLKSGRILAGPWYVLPDEWLISGESFVRNLMKGMAICRGLGFEPMQFSYTPDQFGHIAALPTIATGFGLKAGICWRGTQNERYPSQFVWVGPDGSRLVTHKLSDEGGYNAFDQQVRRPIEDADFAEDSYARYFEPFLAKERARTSAPVLLLIDAVDHQRAPKAMPRLLRELQARYPDVEFVFGTFPQYAAEVIKHLDKLPERRGEHRQPARDASRNAHYLIVHTLSARYPIKRRNDQCQALLEKWAEPYALFQAMDGGAPVLRYLDVAWEYLLQNHPHDSICGCSIDQVHRDMIYRFDQAGQIGDGVVRRALAHIGKAKPACDTIAVHNPLPFARSGVFDVAVRFRPDWPKVFVDGLVSGERINKFALRDPEGKAVPFQICRIERGTVSADITETGRHAPRGGDVYHLAVALDLPPCGYTTLHVEPTGDAVRTQGTMREDSFSACNGPLLLAVEPSGTVTLAAHDGPQDLEELFIYEDCGDSGDGWTRGKLVYDRIVRTPGSRVTTAIEEDGPLRIVFRVDRELDVPRAMDRRTFWRSEERATLHITDWLTLDKDAPVVRVHTRVENVCGDHRLRVAFPTHLSHGKPFADTPFALVTRDRSIPAETAAWHERVNPETAFTSLFGVQDADDGLAVLAPFGLHECEVTGTDDTALVLTLFRSTFQTVNTAGEPDGQLLGTLEFDYLLYPFAAPFDPVAALRLVAAAQAGVQTHTTDAVRPPRSFFRTKHGAAVVTAIKPAADGQGGIVRLWNPTNKPVSDTLHFERRVQSAARCNLNEEVAEPIALAADGGVPVSVVAGGLTTVRVTW